MKRLFPFIPMLLLLSSCNLDKCLQQRQEKLVEEYRAIPDYEQLPIRSISWNQARIMLLNNTEYRQALHNLEQAEYECGQTWKSFIPSIDLGYYYSRALFNNGTNYYGGGELNTNVMFMLPEFIRLPVEHYGKLLAVKKAQIDLIVKRRELVAKLYHLFREKELGERKSREQARARDKLSAQKIAKEQQQLATREQWGKLCTLLNDDSARWQLLPEDLPHVTPESYGKKIELPSVENQQLLAMGLEAARLRKLGVIIEYWPNIHTNFYSPSLFDSSGGNLTGFMQGAKDTRVSLNIYLSLDTKGEKAHSYKEAKFAHEEALIEARQKMREYKEKATLLLKSWEQYREWNKAMAGYIDFRKQQGACHPDDVRTLHEESQSILKEIHEQEHKNIERECALIQEYGLPGE